MSMVRIESATKSDLAMGFGTLAITIAAPLIYRVLPQTYRGAATSFGMGLGIAALALALFSIVYSIRRAHMQYRWGALETWLRIHTYAGLIALLFALLHADGKFRPGAATAALYLLVLTNISGFIGWIIYLYAPAFFAPKNTKTLNSPEETYSKISKLRDKIENLETKLSRTDSETEKLVARIESIEQEIKTLERELQLSLRRELIMGIWLYAHLPISAAFIVAALAHAFVIIYLT